MVLLRQCIANKLEKKNSSTCKGWIYLLPPLNGIIVFKITGAFENSIFVNCHYCIVHTVNCENKIKIHFSCHPDKCLTSCFSTIYYHLNTFGICLPPETNDSNIFTTH